MAEKIGKVHLEALELNEESIKELTDTEAAAVKGGVLNIGGGGKLGAECGEKNTLLSTCTRIDTATNPTKVIGRF